MELKLESDLSHQLLPVNGVAKVVEASIAAPAQQAHQNPLLKQRLDAAALKAVRRQAGLLERAEKLKVTSDMLPDKVKSLPSHSLIDIKMETGTGKTYVYTRTMFELHRRCGINKFIIAVPTLAIKAGTAAFLCDPEARRHFDKVCGYDADIELCLLKPQKKSGKKGRNNMPGAVRRFFGGDIHAKHKIYVLLLNTQLIANAKLLTNGTYDDMPDGFCRPAEVIADTKPVLIIDEPHRMERGGKSYAALIERFKPQLVLRYGATFPEFTVGKGKGKRTVKDYQELIYDLNAAESFSQGLIKGVAKEHLELPGGRRAEKKVKVVSAAKGTSANLKFTTADNGGKTFTMHPGDSLGMIDPDLDGISIESIGQNSVNLSNGQEKLTGEEFFPDQYGMSYQEGMIELALMRHFETERKNFTRDGLPIKTLALFFINSIESFRGADGDNNGWLRRKFLEMLEARLKKELAKQNTPEYAAYLKATLDNLDASCAGYFSQDNNDSDESIASEVKVILHGKKELLSFTHEGGKPNVLRFLFSKWTLKEGWDNPNVFTICKLRSSGSETSKLQEVGRGLRLPVDSVGNRISDSAFMLNYIVDFTEKDFADKLVAEINGELGLSGDAALTFTDDDITKVAEKRNMDANDFFVELVNGKFMDFNKKVRTENFDDMLSTYPEIREVTGWNNTARIVNKNSRSSDKIRIRKERFDELRELWAQLNRKYVLFFDREIDRKIEAALPHIITSNRVFAIQTAASSRNEVAIEDGMAVANDTAHTELTLRNRHYAYNDFLKSASRRTNIPIHVLHKAFCKAHGNEYRITADMFNEGSLTRLVAAVDDWKCKQLVGLVKYKQAKYTAKETKLTNADGSVKDEVVQTCIGSQIEKGDTPDKYLYETYAYDSPLELQNMKTDIEKVVVYGKIPSRSICIPTVASSNYTPDFMYVVKKGGDKKELNIVVETKAYDHGSKISQDETTKIACAEEFFKAMQAAGYPVSFHKQINNKSMRTIIEELVTE